MLAAIIDLKSNWFIKESSSNLWLQMSYRPNTAEKETIMRRFFEAWKCNATVYDVRVRRLLFVTGTATAGV